MEKKKAPPFLDMEEIVAAYEAGYDDKRQVIQISLISSTKRLGKWILEYLVEYRNQAGDREEESIIGKISSNQEKALASYRFMKYLWTNGFENDPCFTVVRPIGYLQNWRLLLMTKAPGRTLEELLHVPSANRGQAVRLAANWLTRMHAVPRAELQSAARTRANPDIGRYYEELVQVISSAKDAEKLHALNNRFLQISDKPYPDQAVLLHGDFHPQNLFINGQKAIAIDFDLHFAGDPAWDVAYMACQMQLSGFYKMGDFYCFQQMIQSFIETYLDAHPEYNRKSFYDRLCLYSARCLFEILHYHLCVLKTGKLSIIDPFLARCRLYLEGTGYH